MKIDLLNASDLPVLPSLQPEGWGDITPPFQLYTANEWCFPMKVIIDGNIAGIGTAIIHGNVAWLAHIIVHPSRRNNGIGLFITKQLVDFCYRKNCETIFLIATDLGAPVYDKAGFITESEYLMYKEVKLANDLQVADTVVQNNGQFDADILAFDRQLMGEDRSMELKPHLQSAHVVITGDKMEGFYLPSFGEGLVVAGNHNAGVELVRLRLRTKENAAFPEENQQLKDFFNDNGFIASRKTKRMFLGKPLTWQPTRLYNRVGGNLG